MGRKETGREKNIHEQKGKNCENEKEDDRNEKDGRKDRKIARRKRNK
jgi:hypothetical protein